MIDVKTLSWAELHQIKREVQQELRLRYQASKPAAYHQTTIDQLTRTA